MSEAYTGGCACGAIRYEIASEPLAMTDCQCRDCQRKSGTGDGSYLTFPSKEHVKLEGSATHWDIVGDSGNVKTRAFCPTCGSPVYLLFAAAPALFTVHAASLDDPGTNLRRRRQLLHGAFVRGGDRFVLLATDGGPNCGANDTTCAADHCTPNLDGSCPISC